jgi:hypothetical protein
MIATLQCREVAERMPEYADRELPAELAKEMDAHLAACKACREGLRRYQSVDSLWRGTSQRDADRQLAQTGKWLEGVSSDSLLKCAQSHQLEAQPSRLQKLLSGAGAAPWWFVSATLHVLVIALATLVTMSLDFQQNDDAVVMITDLYHPQNLTPAVEEKKADKTDVLARKDTPATDPASTEASDVVIPPEILAQAEVGDHFETINLDKPDTHSAFGNPESTFFYSREGNDDKAGGGGTGGIGMDDLIGVGGAGARGSGGGFGGGDGTGTGLGQGAGKGSFGQRSGGGRKLMVMRNGGSKATESAVDKALQWLAYHQEADGHWNLQKYRGKGAVVWGSGHDEGMSALATLAFLGAGHTLRIGAYRDNVKRAVKWIVSKERPDGSFREPEGGGGYDQYDDAMCALALCEAYAMTHDYDLEEPTQRSVDYIIKQQQSHGGWNHGHNASTSTLGWMVMALKSAKVAGIKVPMTTFENAIRRLNDVGEKDAEGYWGKIGYASKGHSYSGKGLTMTAVGMVALQFMGQGHETSQQAEMLATNLPEWKAGLSMSEVPQNFYHWYYSTLGMFQNGGDLWRKWNEALKNTLLPHQRVGGDEDGSWDPETTWDPSGGRVYTTAMGALCLEVYYRYLRLSEK